MTAMRVLLILAVLGLTTAAFLTLTRGGEDDVHSR